MTGKWKNPDVPQGGWECIDIKDLGESIIVCQMCEREEIRYAHYMRHHNFQETLIVGCICAGRMEGSLDTAKERDSFIKKRMNKRKSWLSKYWNVSRKGNQYIKSDGYIIFVKKDNELWSAFIQNENGAFKMHVSGKSPNENEMKLVAFDCLTKVLVTENILIKQQVKKIYQKPKITESERFEFFNSELEISEQKITEPVYVENKKNYITPYCEVIQHDLFETSDNVMLFTAEQNNIFEFIRSGSGHGIIDAVAGAGKTTTIMECARYVADKTDVLFCAFNKSIQTEITNKFNKQGLNQITVKTIHALGFQILKENNITGKKIVPDENKYKTILNKDAELQDEIKVYLNELICINGFEPDETESKKQFAVKELVYLFKDRLLDINQKIRATLTVLDLDNFKKLIEHFNFFSEVEISSKTFNKEIELYFESSKILLNAGNAAAKESLIIDYTDMLYLPYILNLRASKTYSFLFIDECQDLSKSQLAIVLKYGNINGRILAVGDPFQSIYGFAGADIDSFSRVRDTINARPLPLTTCFRCPPNVVNLAASIRQDIRAKKQESGIIEEISFKQVINRAGKNDLIISRYREPILFLVFDFINQNKRVQIHRDEVYEIINELKNLFKQEERNVTLTEDNGGFELIKKSVINRWKYIINNDAMKLTNSIERQIYVQSKTEYLNNRLEFLHKKYLQWKNVCPAIDDILKKIKEFISASDNCVKLSTIHRAKGLEAERVFILNFDELPYFKPNQKYWESLQEKNLKYVAITRAMRELYLVRSEKRDYIQKEASLFDEFVIK